MRELIKKHLKDYIKLKSLSNLVVDGDCILFNGQCTLCLDNSRLCIWCIRGKSAYKDQEIDIRDPQSIQTLERYMEWINKEGYFLTDPSYFPYFQGKQQ